MKQIHVCLLSNQLLPNLIPVLTENPHRVYLIVTQEMEQSGHDKRMRRILRKKNIEVLIRPRAPSTGLASIRKFAAKIANELISAEAGNRIVLNATGGTKLLAMGFVEIFRTNLEGYPLQVIYTDTEHQMIETLVPRDQTPTPMQSVLDTESYLAAQGMVLGQAASDQEAWQTRARTRAPLTEYLATKSEELGHFFATINGMVRDNRGDKKPVLSKHGDRVIQAKQQFNHYPSGLWKQALTRIADAALISWDGNQEIHFDSAESAVYLSGGWLEEYAWLAAEAAELQDVRCSATGRWESYSGSDAPTNEFDLLAVQDNRILIVECKTGTHEGSEQAIATRLDSLAHNAGGLFGTVLLVSARGLPSTMQQRCKSLHIRVLEKSAIALLPAHIKVWRNTGNIPSA